MMKLTGMTRTTYILEPNRIASGGEGDIYRVSSQTGLVAKIYQHEVLSAELEKKLNYMVNHPPAKSVLTQVAWPRDVVANEAGQFCGFIMPELQINASLSDVYKYPARPGFPITMRNKIMIAQNICVVINEVHSAGYIFGDFNPLNSGLDTDTGRISFLDTDTYHVYDGGSGTTYRCNVCAPGYCAPELLEKVSSHVANNPLASQNAYAQTPLPTFTKETDNFALAIHIFKLLMNGYTPYGGIIDTAAASQASPGIGDSAVRRDSYCFKPGYKHQSAAIPALESLPKEIVDLFTLAFINGRVDPEKRPTAEMWYGALERYEQVLIDCRKNRMHQYDKKNTDCPLCAADRAYMQAIGQNPTPIQTTRQAPTPVQPTRQAPIPTQPISQAPKPVQPVSQAPTQQPVPAAHASVPPSQPHAAQAPTRKSTSPVYQQNVAPIVQSPVYAPQQVHYPPPTPVMYAKPPVSNSGGDVNQLLSNSDRIHKLIGRLYIVFGVVLFFAMQLSEPDTLLAFTEAQWQLFDFGVFLSYVLGIYMVVAGVLWIAKRYINEYTNRFMIIGIVALTMQTLLIIIVMGLPDISFALIFVILFAVTLVIMSLVYLRKYRTTKSCVTCGTVSPARSLFCKKCGIKFN